VVTRDVSAPSAAWPLQGALPLRLGDSLVPHAGDKTRIGAGVHLGGMVAYPPKVPDGASTKANP
jgi:hypothetical protein